MDMTALFILLSQNITKNEEIKMAIIFTNFPIKNHKSTYADFNDVYYNVSGSILHLIINHIF